MKSTSEGTFDERRGHPTDDPVDWAHTTRDSIYASVKRCIVRALDQLDDARSSELAFAELNTGIGTYARGLYALGHTEDDVVALVRSAAWSASASRKVYPRMLVAIEEWCREAHS